jgi:hypothetical protein
MDGNAEIAVDGVKSTEALGHSLDLDEQRPVKKARVESDEGNKADPIDVEGESHSVPPPSAAPEQKDGNGK